MAAVDNSPMADLVTQAAARLAAADGRAVYVVHAQEDVTASDVATDGEDLEDSRALVRKQLDLLAAHQVPAQGEVLRHAPGHGVAGRMIAEYAATIGGHGRGRRRVPRRAARADGQQREPGIVAAR